MSAGPEGGAGGRAPPARRVGPYVLEGQLGAGGMGAVYRARHAGHGAVRALKVLIPRGDAADAARGLARFEREARLLAQVRHPNLVALHDAGAEGGQAWLGMDLVEGEPLDRLLARGRLPLDRALGLLEGVCRGVAALHAAGVAHRDLKPQNVLVRPDGQPIVIDLGLALAGDEADRLTRTGAFVGTLLYAAPEQVGGQRAAQGPPTDVCALGLLLFELATGRAPYEADPAGELGLVARILREGPPPPSTVDPDLPARLDDLVARATARDPSRRPADARALLREVVALRAAPGPSRRARRRRAAAGAAGAALVLALAAAVGALARSPAGPPPAAAPPAGPLVGPAPGPPPGTGAPGPDAPLDPAREIEARGALRRALGQADPARRLEALAGWLAAWPGLPERAQAEAAWREARVLVPLQQEPGAHAAWPAIARAGPLLVTVDAALALVWSVDAGGRLERRGQLPLQGGALCAGARGARVLVGTRAGALLELDPTGPSARPLLRAASPITAVAGTARHGRIAVGLAGRRGGVVLLLDPEGGRDGGLREVGRLATTDLVADLAWRPDGGAFAVLSGSSSAGAAVGEGRNVVHLLDGATASPLARRDAVTFPTVAAWAPDGATLWVGTIEGQVLALRGGDLELAGQLEGPPEVQMGLGSTVAHDASVRGLAVDPAGRWVVSVADTASKDKENQARAWDPTTWAPLRPAAALPFRPRGLALLGDAGAYAAVVDLEGGVHVLVVDPAAPAPPGPARAP